MPLFETDPRGECTECDRDGLPVLELQGPDACDFPTTVCLDCVRAAAEELERYVDAQG